MPSLSHHVDFCIVPRLKWKIIPPPEVIPPKPARIIRFANYRQRIPLYPTSPILLGVSVGGSIICTELHYYFYVKPHRRRLREYFFGVCARDEPASQFLREWQDQQPSYPTNMEEMEEIQEMCRTNTLYGEAPLVPYDVPGIKWNKVPTQDKLKQAQIDELYRVRINFMLPGTW